MGQGRPNTPILLDWATISYRSIMRGVVYLVLLMAMGGVFYYLRAARRTTPEELALQEINRAERMYREAQASADASFTSSTNRSRPFASPSLLTIVTWRSACWRRALRSLANSTTPGASPSRLPAAAD